GTGATAAVNGPLQPVTQGLSTVVNGVAGATGLNNANGGLLGGVLGNATGGTNDKGGLLGTGLLGKKGAKP
ncbi:hypothetical protein JTP77_042680, partial [Streptomyces sp. S9]|nr:hypothetical protein [Streptomyces sp. S9]